MKRPFDQHTALRFESVRSADLIHDDEILQNPERAWAPLDSTNDVAWNRTVARHLFRRSGFGVESSQIEESLSAGFDATISSLFTLQTDERYESTFNSLAAAVGPRRAPEANVALWLYAMLHSPNQLVEKSTLFWHGHFATSAAKVTNPKLMLDQNKVLREHALGSFDAMVKAISRDPAMLIYLDSTDNRKTHPNENYARELMELFCLGIGNYTEQDIQEVARCFTGWEVRREVFRFNRNQHDFGTKQFLGQNGEFDGDDAVNIILSQPAAATFIARKLLRYYVADFESVPEGIVEPLAEQLRESNFDIASTIEMIFRSRLFYSDVAVGRKIRSPLELVIGTMRLMGANANLYDVSNTLNELGQRPYYPPNVKGWDGGRVWINSSTQLTRLNFVHRLVHDQNVSFASGSLENWLDDLGVSGISDTIEFLTENLLALPASSELREQLDELARRERRDRTRQLQTLITTIGSAPEFQLG